MPISTGTILCASTSLVRDIRYVSKKMTLIFRNAFPKCVCGAARAANWKASSANRKASSENRRFLPKKRKASSEERWVRTHIGFRNAVQLRLWIFRGRVCVFQSCVCVFRAALVTESRTATERFLQAHVIFKDAYCRYYCNLVRYAEGC